MVFSSLIFLFLFLPACLICYFLVPGLKAKNLVLVVFSLVFYAWGEPFYVLLLLASAAMNYFAGLLMGGCRRRGKSLKPVLVGAVALNLLALGVFKYAALAVTTLNQLAGLALPVPQIALPIGISFYTFQAMSYVVDVYRDEVGVQRSYGKFLLYISLFPQLIAGPIVRYSDIEAQLEDRHASREDMFYGLIRFAIGLGKKILIADHCYTVVTQMLDGSLSSATTVGTWLGILMFTFQIYFDFSGYSDMAIGLGRIFGFRFNENFDHPYCADSVGTFWRRWHMSLTTWFRDYLYIPLGGNRGGTVKTIRNLIIVWFCTGFWHGASWNFVLWGLYFAAWLILERYVLRGVLEKTPKVLKHVYTLIVVFVGWGLFAMVDLSVCGDYLAACFGNAPLWSAADGFRLRGYAVSLVALVLASTGLGQRLWAELPRGAEALFTPVLMGLSLVVCTAYLVDGSYNPFLYFRF